jgi:hypothetical protein
LLGVIALWSAAARSEQITIAWDPELAFDFDREALTTRAAEST